MTPSNVSHSERPHVTVRELGGEVWSELWPLPDAELHWQTKNRVVDLVMGVGAAIRNDADLPVEPLPARRDD